MRYFIRLCFLLYMLCIHTMAMAQNSNVADVEDFCFLIHKVEANYSGFPTKVTDSTRVEYQEMRTRLLTDVIGGSSLNDAIGQYIVWFRDYHLWTSNGAEKKYRKYRTDYSAMEYAPKPVALTVDKRTFLIRFPSCASGMAKFAQEAVDKFRESGCENLIIDIRGNGGGSDGAYGPLLPLVYDHPGGGPFVEFRVSPDNCYLLRQWFGEGELRAELEKSGEEFYNPVAKDYKVNKLELDSVESLPKRVGVIIDGAIASSGEQFLRDARSCSDRMTIYGRDNTLGCLDYSNCNIIPLPNSKISVSVPMSRVIGLPAGAIDYVGIAPEVQIPLPLPGKLTDNIDEWTLWVAKQLRKSKK